MPLTVPTVADLVSMVQGPNSGKASIRVFAPAARWAGLSCSKDDRKTKMVRFQNTSGASEPALTAEGVLSSHRVGRALTSRRHGQDGRREPSSQSRL